MNGARVAVRTVLGMLAAGCVWGLVQLQAGEARPRGSLGPERGRVTYRFSRPGLSGRTVFSWTDHGHAYRQDLDVRNTTDTVLGRGPQFWMLRAKTKTAQQARRGPNDLWMNADSVPYVTPDTGTGEIVGEGRVLDRACEIRRIHSMQVWLWEGLPLRMEREPGSKLPAVSLVATALESAPALPSDHFHLPPGYAVADFPGHKAHPWTAIATAGLSLLLVLLGIGGWAVEWSFARNSRNNGPASTLYVQ